jgi:Lar family restriction alleviation protein
MPAESGLLNCPFCGAEGLPDFTFVGPTDSTVYYIRCCNCEAGTRYHATLSGAEAAWNQRANTKEENLQQPTTSPCCKPEAGQTA